MNVATAVGAVRDGHLKYCTFSCAVFISANFTLSLLLPSCFCPEVLSTLLLRSLGSTTNVQSFCPIKELIRRPQRTETHLPLLMMTYKLSL